MCYEYIVRRKKWPPQAQQVLTKRATHGRPHRHDSSDTLIASFSPALAVIADIDFDKGKAVILMVPSSQGAGSVCEGIYYISSI